MRLTLLLIASSFVTACAGIPAPKTYVCVVNAANDLPVARRKCYNMETDYDADGIRKPEAKPIYRDNPTIKDLNKFMVIDGPTGTVDGQAALSAWLQKVRKHYKACDQGSQPLEQR
jgi:hypothetical protein